jgi:hypothetical protein
MNIHTDKLRWLVWLRWKMLLRGFSRSKGRVATILGTIFLLLAILACGSVVSVGTFFGYRFAPAPFNSEILFLVLTGVFIFWFIAPLMQASTNEGLDVSKLELFPLTRAELMISLLLSTLLDLSTILIVLVFASILAGWTTSILTFLMILLVLLVFYVMLIAVSQLVIALLSRMLHSRRLRDLSVLLAVLVSVLGASMQFIVRGAVNENFLNLLRDGFFSQYLQWLPSGMAARAILGAVEGNWGSSFAWLGGLLVLSLVMLYLWQIVMERALTSAETGGGAIRTRQQARQAQVVAERVTEQAGWLSRLRSSQIVAIAVKDLKYFRRDPQLGAMIVQSLISVGVLTGVFLVNSSGGLGQIAHGNPWVVMIAPVYAGLALYSLTYNMLGFERQSLTTLFLFPIEPQRLLWGKNLVVGAIGLIEMVLIILVAAFLTQGWSMVLPAFAVGLACLGVILASGNLTSVLLPQRMRQARRGFQVTQTSAEAGCLRSILSMVALFVMYIVLAPVAAAFLLPFFFNVTWIWAISVPATLLYGFLIYYYTTKLVAPRIVTNAPEILAQVAKE